MSRNDVLVTTDWAQENLGTPGLVFVEVDEDTAAYDGGHLEGAVKLDWKKDLQDPLRRDFVDKAAFEALLSAKGISNDDTVVLYGGNNNWFAAYAYWYFKLYGHRDVKLIDGGRKKWELDGRPLSKDTVQRPATQYRASDPDLSIRAFRDEVVASIGSKNIIDVRSPDEFSGKILAPAHLPQEQAQRGGNVTTAKNIPWSKAANEDGTFKSDAELEARYAEQGFDESKAPIAYCRIGEPSSHTWFVLRELLGKSDVKNYDGSWVEYGSLVGVPVEKGADMCGAPKQGGALAGIDLSSQTVIQGQVWHDGSPVAGAYVRLLDETDEFTAEVVTSPEGEFRFFAAPGTWTLRSLSPIGRAERRLAADVGLNETTLAIA